MRTRLTDILLTVSLVATASAATCGDTAGPKSYFLVLSTAGSGTGTISAAPAGNEDGGYPEGATVTITATASTGAEFTGWDEFDVKGCTEPRNPCTLVMTDRKSVAAKFVPNSGAARHDGLYTGTVGAGSSIGAQPVNLTMVNGVVQGKIAPFFGSQPTFTGTVSAAGAFSATIASGPGSNCGAGNPLPSGSWSATRDLIHVEKIG